MLDIRYCSRCNTIYKYGGKEFCPNCCDELEDIMLKVRSFLEENPDAGVQTIAKGVNAREKDILYLLKEGRLFIKKKAEADDQSCIRCGDAISVGRFCSNCLAQIKKEFSKAKCGLEEPRKSNVSSSASSEVRLKGKMYTASRHKEK